ncbi:hypothetical protein GG344DRAFT_71053 [Lentinula edodes]|nr:hypothetical protein GG344DRAFT_71053 [Lentinula edodes]
MAIAFVRWILLAENMDNIFKGLIPHTISLAENMGDVFKGLIPRASSNMQMSRLSKDTVQLGHMSCVALLAMVYRSLSGLMFYCQNCLKHYDGPEKRAATIRKARQKTSNPQDAGSVSTKFILVTTYVIYMCLNGNSTAS